MNQNILFKHSLLFSKSSFYASILTLFFLISSLSFSSERPIKETTTTGLPLQDEDNTIYPYFHDQAPLDISFYLSIDEDPRKEPVWLPISQKGDLAERQAALLTPVGTSISLNPTPQAEFSSTTDSSVISSKTSLSSSSSSSSSSSTDSSSQSSHYNAWWPFNWNPFANYGDSHHDDENSYRDTLKNDEKEFKVKEENEFKPIETVNEKKGEKRQSGDAPLELTKLPIQPVNSDAQVDSPSLTDLVSDDSFEFASISVMPQDPIGINSTIPTLNLSSHDSKPLQPTNTSDARSQVQDLMSQNITLLPPLSSTNDSRMIKIIENVPVNKSLESIDGGGLIILQSQSQDKEKNSKGIDDVPFEKISESTDKKAPILSQSHEKEKSPIGIAEIPSKNNLNSNDDSILLQSQSQSQVKEKGQKVIDNVPSKKNLESTDGGAPILLQSQPQSPNKEPNQEDELQQWIFRKMTGIENDELINSKQNYTTDPNFQILKNASSMPFVEEEFKTKTIEPSHNLEIPDKPHTLVENKKGIEDRMPITLLSTPLEFHNENMLITLPTNSTSIEKSGKKKEIPFLEIRMENITLNISSLKSPAALNDSLNQNEPDIPSIDVPPGEIKVKEKGRKMDPNVGNEILLQDKPINSLEGSFSSFSSSDDFVYEPPHKMERINPSALFMINTGSRFLDSVISFIMDHVLFQSFQANIYALSLLLMIPFFYLCSSNWRYLIMTFGVVIFGTHRGLLVLIIWACWTVDWWNQSSFF